MFDWPGICNVLCANIYLCPCVCLPHFPPRSGHNLQLLICVVLKSHPALVFPAEIFIIEQTRFEVVMGDLSTVFCVLGRASKRRSMGKYLKYFHLLAITARSKTGRPGKQKSGSLGNAHQTIWQGTKEIDQYIWWVTHVLSLTPTIQKPQNCAIYRVFLLKRFEIWISLI